MGERKKLQIAAALFRQPDVLCIDEPTNRLDAGTRELLMRELKKFQGIGILVSHDRELLDSLCDQCLFLEHGKAVLRPGGVRLERLRTVLTAIQVYRAAGLGTDMQQRTWTHVRE